MNAFERLAAGALIVVLIALSAGVLGFAGQRHFDRFAFLDRIERAIEGDGMIDAPQGASLPPDVRPPQAPSINLGAALTPLDPAQASLLP